MLFAQKIILSRTDVLKTTKSSAILFEKWEICVRLGQREVRFGRSWVANNNNSIPPLQCTNAICTMNTDVYPS